MSATISLQHTNRAINDSETVYFVIQEHHLIGSCIFCKIVCVLPVVLQSAPPGGEKKKYQLQLFTLFRPLCPAFSFAEVDTYGVAIARKGMCSRSKGKGGRGQERKRAASRCKGRDKMAMAAKKWNVINRTKGEGS